MSEQSIRVGVLFWHPREGFGLAVVECLQGMGCDVTILIDGQDSSIPDLDVVLIYGPWGSIEPTVRKLKRLPPSRRPIVALWHSEQFPNPKLPWFVWFSIGILRSYIESAVYDLQTSRVTRFLTPSFSWLTSKLHRFRYYGDAYRYTRQGELGIFAVWSDWTTRLLRERGLDPMVAYMGSHPGWGRDMGIERDIPVLWLGKTATDRRAKLLRKIRKQLEARGIKMMCIDGVEHPYVFGEERTAILNRTRIVLNLLRKEWDNTSMRFFLAVANRALIVTEPIYPHTPFLSGDHLIVSPISEMADTIEHFLQNESERKVIVDRAYDLVTSDLTMVNSLHKILDKAMQLRHKVVSGVQSGMKQAEI